MNFSGEQVVYDAMHGGDLSLLQDSIHRYSTILHHCDHKKVLDAGCGTGIGTFLLSLVADRVFGVDHRKEAIMHAMKLPFACPVEFKTMNLEKETIKGHFDIACAFEVLEHVSNPEFVVDHIDADLLLITVPINFNTSPDWHKQTFSHDDMVRIISNKFTIVESREILRGEFFVCKHK